MNHLCRFVRSFFLSFFFFSFRYFRPSYRHEGPCISNPSVYNAPLLHADSSKTSLRRLHDTATRRCDRNNVHENYERRRFLRTLDTVQPRRHSGLPNYLILEFFSWFKFIANLSYTHTGNCVIFAAREGERERVRERKKKRVFCTWITMSFEEWVYLLAKIALRSTDGRVFFRVLQRFGELTLGIATSFTNRRLPSMHLSPSVLRQTNNSSIFHRQNDSSSNVTSFANVGAAASRQRSVSRSVT